MYSLFLRNVFHKWNAVVRLDSKQLIINTKRPFKGALIATMLRYA